VRFLPEGAVSLETRGGSTGSFKGSTPTTSELTPRLAKRKRNILKKSGKEKENSKEKSIT